MSKSMKGFGRAGLSALATSTLVIGACAAFVAPANADANFKFERVGGQTAYDVSANAAEHFGNADHVILASGEPGKYGDALAANYLAGIWKSPVLLTQFNETPAAIQAALQKIGAKQITIVGGPLSVSPEQQQALSQNYTVDRIEGHTRFDVDAAVIKKGATTGNTAIIATGDKFPDALSAGPLAYAKNFPVGLVQRDDAHADDVLKALTDQGVNQAIVLGGDLSISQEVRQKITDAGIKIIFEAKQYNGDTGRGGVAAALANYEVANYNFSVSRVNVVTGREYHQGADALSAGPVTGKLNRALLITSGDPKVGAEQATGPGVLGWLKDHALTLTGDDNLLFGGPLSISDAQQALMEQAAQSVTSNQSYNVTPSQATTVNTESSNNTTKVTFSGISASQVDLRLIDCSAQTTDSNGQTSFGDTNNDNNADLSPAVDPSDAQITEINGVGSSYGVTPNNVDVQNGTVTATVTTNNPGCYQLVAFEDKNKDGQLNLDANNKPTEPFAMTGAINAVAPAAAEFVNSPTTAPYGSYTATVQLTDGTGSNATPVKIAGVPVLFNRQLPDGSSVQQTATTDANGKATYTFSVSDPHTSSGDSTPMILTATPDLEQNGKFSDNAGDSVSQTVTFSDQAATPSNVAVSTDKTTARVGDTVTATATETDQYGQPVSGEAVTFTVTQPGSAPLTATRTTDATGKATFSFKVSAAGDYKVTATDADGNSDTTGSTVTAYDSGAQNTRTGTVYGSFDAAQAAAQPGDTIQVFGSTAHPVGSLTVTQAGITVDGSGAGTLKEATIEVKAPNVTVKNFTIDNTPTGSNSRMVGIVFNGISGVGGNVSGGTASNNSVSNAQTGVFVESSAGTGNASNVTVSGNTLTNNVSGVATDTADAVAVTNNTIKNNDEGVGVGGVNVSVSGNTFSTDTPASDAYIRWYVTVPSSTVTSTQAANGFNPPANATTSQGHQALTPTGYTAG